MDTLPPLVDPEELLKRLQRDEFGDLEAERVEAVCEDASDLVRGESGKDWLDPDDPTKVVAPRYVLLIARRCAERAVRNPEGYSSESAGDYSYQRRGAEGEGGTFLTEREVRALKQASGKSGLWTQPTTRGDSCYPDAVYLQATGSVDWMPAGAYPDLY